MRKGAPGHYGETYRVAIGYIKLERNSVILNFEQNYQVVQLTVEYMHYITLHLCKAGLLVAAMILKNQ